MPKGVVDETPPIRDDYQLAVVDGDYFTDKLRPKQFLHIDQAECIICEGCVDICPWKCIHYLSLDAISEGVNVDHPAEDPQNLGFFIVDEDECTRCALCVDRCPTNVISLGKFEGSLADQAVRARSRSPALGLRYRPARLQEWLRLRDALVGGVLANGNGKIGITDRVKEANQKLWSSQVAESILRPGSPFKKGYSDSPRNRSYVVMNNVLYHLHPVKVKRHGVKLSYTLCLGGLSFFLFILLTITGIFLMFYYTPSAETAYADIEALSTSVAFGSLVRNMHRWGAHLMVLSVFLHMSRVFYHGAYKPPREFNWVVGVILLLTHLAPLLLRVPACPGTNWPFGRSPSGATWQGSSRWWARRSSSPSSPGSRCRRPPCFASTCSMSSPCPSS